MFEPFTLSLWDSLVWHFWSVQLDIFGPFTLTLWFIQKDRPFLVEWWSTLPHYRPVWRPLKRLSDIVLNRPLWLKWPSSFAWPSILRTVNFHPLNQTQHLINCFQSKNNVSNLKSLFPIYFFVSNLTRWFQFNLFSIYILPSFWWLNNGHEKHGHFGKKRPF